MPKFRIEQYEIHTMAYETEADTAAEAVVKVLNGLALPVGNSLEYVQVADDYGLPTEGNHELADQLRSLGVPVEGPVISSIRNIERVD